MRNTTMLKYFSHVNRTFEFITRLHIIEKRERAKILIDKYSTVHEIFVFVTVVFTPLHNIFV